MKVSVIATRLAVGEAAIYQAVDDIRTYNKYWIEIIEPTAFGETAVIQKTFSAHGAIQQFLREGGVTGLENTKQAQAAIDYEHKKLEMIKNKLEIENLEATISRSKTAHRVSIIAIVLAGATLIFEVVKYFIK